MNPDLPARSNLQLKAIVAYSRNRTIGKDNDLPWRLPGDLKHFKQVTLGHPVIMGRRTWESIGRPLPGRLNIVISSTLQNDLAGATVVNSIEQAIAAASAHEQAFIIGGANLYAQSLDCVDEVIATEIDADIQGDAHFPVLEANTWEITDAQPQPAENGLSYTFVTYKRIQNPQTLA